MASFWIERVDLHGDAQLREGSACPRSFPETARGIVIAKDQVVLQVYLLAGDLLRLRSVPLPTR